ncbi:MAG: hypothetical protein CGW95_05475 [Phenylobacterium zucineum]|nr:MAG: hypothetical protein CGW95_05475 [Phenylobacterium zucineum]
MAKSKTEKAAKAEKTASKTFFDPDIARKIWLAGVGAYGRAYDGATDAAEKFAEKANHSFDDLVAKGEKIEDLVRTRIAKAPAGKKVADMVEDITKKTKDVAETRRAALDARLEDVKKSLGETFAPFNMTALSHAVEGLTKQVEVLTAEVAALKAEKTKKPTKTAQPAETVEGVET